MSALGWQLEDFVECNTFGFDLFFLVTSQQMWRAFSACVWILVVQTQRWADKGQCINKVTLDLCMSHWVTVPKDTSVASAFVNGWHLEQGWPLTLHTRSGVRDSFVAHSLLSFNSINFVFAVCTVSNAISANVLSISVLNRSCPLSLVLCHIDRLWQYLTLTTEGSLTTEQHNLFRRLNECWCNRMRNFIGSHVFFPVIQLWTLWLKPFWGPPKFYIIWHILSTCTTLP